MTYLITKGTTPVDKSGNGNINFVKIESIDSSSGEISISSKISEEEHNGYLRRSQLQENDILFSIAGTLGRVTSVNKGILPANINQALAIIRLKTGCLDYVKTYLKGNAVADFIKKNPTIGAQPNLSLEQIGNLVIDLPSYREQQEIGTFFCNLGNLITLYKRKLDKLKKLKKSYLQKMFPQEGEDIPQVRFAGFCKPWEQRKLGEIINRVTIQSDASNVPKIEFEDIVSGEGRLNKDISNKFDKRKGIAFEPNNILYGKLRPYLKNWLFANFKGVALGDFWVLNARNSSPIFDYYLIQTEKYQEAANLSTGTKMPRADWRTVSEITFSIPKDKKEQTAIGNFFCNLDDQIATTQHKLDYLNQLKAAYLQKMFI